jgi:hypothetical protein
MASPASQCVFPRIYQRACGRHRSPLVSTISRRPTSTMSCATACGVRSRHRRTARRTFENAAASARQRWDLQVCTFVILVPLRRPLGNSAGCQLRPERFHPPLVVAEESAVPFFRVCFRMCNICAGDSFTLIWTSCTPPIEPIAYSESWWRFSQMLSVPNCDAIITA